MTFVPLFCFTAIINFLALIIGIYLFLFPREIAKKGYYKV